MGWTAMGTKQSQPAREGEELYSSVCFGIGQLYGEGRGEQQKDKRKKRKKGPGGGAGLSGLVWASLG